MVRRFAPTLTRSLQVDYDAEKQSIVLAAVRFDFDGKFLADKSGVQTIPSFVVFDDVTGIELARHEGRISENQLRSFLTKSKIPLTRKAKP